MDEKNAPSHFNKFLLLRSGQLISAIGGGLTSFGLGVYVFNQTGHHGNRKARYNRKSTGGSGKPYGEFS